VAILAGFVMKFLTFAFRTSLQHAIQGRCVAIHDRADHLALLIRQAMGALVFTYVSPENISNLKAQML
jgi:hypothetical protein